MISQKAVSGVKAIKGNNEGWEAVREVTAPRGIETAFFCLGGEVTDIFNQVKKVMAKSPDGLPQGRIVFSGRATITTQLASASGNLQLLSSAKAGAGYRDPVYEGGTDYPGFYVRWPVQRNVEVILKAIADKKISVEPLITHEYQYTDALEAYTKLAEKNTDAMAVLLKYE